MLLYFISETTRYMSNRIILITQKHHFFFIYATKLNIFYELSKQNTKNLKFFLYFCNEFLTNELF